MEISNTMLRLVHCSVLKHATINSGSPELLLSPAAVAELACRVFVLYCSNVWWGWHKVYLNCNREKQLMQIRPPNKSQQRIENKYYVSDSLVHVWLCQMERGRERKGEKVKIECWVWSWLLICSRSVFSSMTSFWFFDAVAGVKWIFIWSVNILFHWIITSFLANHDIALLFVRCTHKLTKVWKAKCTATITKVLSRLSPKLLAPNQRNHSSSGKLSPSRMLCVICVSCRCIVDDK